MTPWVISTVNSEPVPFPWIRHWHVESTGTISIPSEIEDSYENSDDIGDFDTLSALWETPVNHKKLDELVDAPLLILKGPPGGGKSTELRRAVESGLFDFAGGKAIFRRSSAISAKESLIRGIFDRPDWQVSFGTPVRLVIDGVDELLQHDAGFLEQLTERVRDEIALRGPDAIRLAFTCRSWDWDSADKGITSLWPRNACVTASLCPLTPASGADYVTHRVGNSATAFWNEVQSKNVAPLTSWPQSLILLVDEFECNAGKLPGSHFELIRKATQRLCNIHGDWDKTRRKRLQDGEFDLNWMFRVASRVAALSIFTAKQTIAVTSHPEEPHVLSLEEWRHSDEPWTNGQTREIAQRDVDDLPHTGLFDAATSTTVSFAQVYREHLAAAWLSARNTPVLQLANLFGHGSSTQWQHFPQLSAVAAWLAGDPEQKEWRQFLIQEDPSVLLRADAAPFSDAEKIEIAQALLNRAKKDQAVHQGIEPHIFRGLACPGLAKTVLPFLQDFSNEAEASRDMALDIVCEAQLASLAPVLWEQVQNTATKSRSMVALTLRQIVPNRDFEKWTSVINEEIPSDDHGNLIGAALDIMICKTKRLRVRDALHWLIPERHFDVFGRFEYAIRDLLQEVEAEDIAPILERSAGCPGYGLSVRSERVNLVSVAIQKLATQLDQTASLKLLVRWWWQTRGLGHGQAIEWARGETDSTHPTWNDLGFENAARRRLFFHLLAANHVDDTTCDIAATTCWRIVRLEEDTEWLLQQLILNPGGVPKFWARMASWPFKNPAIRNMHRDMLKAAYAAHGLLRSMLPTPDGIDILDHLDAQDVRFSNESYDDEHSKKRAAREAADQALASSQLSRARELFHQNSPAAWPLLTEALVIGQRRDCSLAAIRAVKAEDWMRDAAVRFLLHLPPSFDTVDAKLRGHFQIEGAWALYALWLDETRMNSVFSAVSSHWLPYIFCQMYRAHWMDEAFDIKSVLARFGEPGVFGFMQFAVRDYAQNEICLGIDMVVMWTPEAIELLRRTLIVNIPQPSAFGAALRFLARYQPDVAFRVAQHWLAAMSCKAFCRVRVTVISAIMVQLKGKLWDRIKLLIWDDKELTRRALYEGVVRFGLHTDNLIHDWPNDYLADIAELMLRTFDPDRDPKHENGEVSPRSQAQHCRDQMLNAFGARGMVDEMKRLRAIRPKQGAWWLAQIELKARNNRTAGRWQPLTSGEILEFVKRHDIRLVTDNDGLMQAVMVAIRGYERELHHRTDASFGVFKTEIIGPEHEERLSDDLRLWLDKKLPVATSREAQVNIRKVGKELGYTDIEVALTRAQAKPLRLTIEVKKNDSRELMMKMKTQLLEEYLTPRSETHGLYTVFWLGDGAAGNHPGISTPTELQEALDKQASQLSSGGQTLRALVIDCVSR